MMRAMQNSIGRPALAAGVVVVSVAAGTALASPRTDDGFDWVTIGDVGNAAWEPDLSFSQVPRPAGRVDYAFRIARTETSSEQWFPFYRMLWDNDRSMLRRLNPAAQIPGLGGIGQDLDIFGAPIDIFLRPGQERVAVGVTFATAMAYANWMHNGRTSDPSSILTGAYDIRTYIDRQGLEPIPERSADARYWLPSLDEWTKAAYYDPTKANADGTLGGYWTFTNQSDTLPVPGLPGEPGAQTSAGLGEDDLGTLWRSLNLGDYPDQMSYYGLLDLSGGAAEYIDTGRDPETFPAEIGVRGSFIGEERHNFVSDLCGMTRSGDAIFRWGDYYQQYFTGGLRLATSVPSSGSLSIAAAALLSAGRRRRATA
jgi:formylglycine-generating enzyme required for sulfatase activity